MRRGRIPGMVARMSVQEIEIAIEKLEPQDYERLRVWLEDLDAERRLQWMRGAVQVGLEQWERGQVFDGPATMRAMIARLDDEIAAEEKLAGNA